MCSTWQGPDCEATKRFPSPQVSVPFSLLLWLLEITQHHQTSIWLLFFFYFGPFSAFARMLTPWNERPLSVYCTAEAPGAQSRLIAGNQLNDWMHMIVITTIIFLKEMRMARNKRLLYCLFIPQIYNGLRWRAYAMEVNGPNSEFGVHPFLECVTCCYYLTSLSHSGNSSLSELLQRWE